MSLSEGKNTVTVKIKDNERQYNLNIIRESSGTSSSTTTSSTSNLTTSLSEGWQQTSGNWYFIAPDESKQTGWQKVDGKWYYMNEIGVIQTGWLKSSSSGKLHYLNTISNGFKGAMLTNTIIYGYRIDSDGSRTN